MSPLLPVRELFRFFKSLYLTWRSVPWLMDQLHDARRRLATVEHHQRTRPPSDAVRALLERSQDVAGPSPLVSVVIPCFNHARLLEEAVDSVTAQTLADVEVIVVDDASSDDTAETTVRLAALHPRLALRLLQNDENRGLAETRNAGFRHARAPLVFPLDADNRIAPTCLAELRDALEREDAAFAYSWRQEFGESDALVKPPPFDLKRMRRGNTIDAMALIRKAAWETVGGYKSIMRYGWEDYELWLNFGSRGYRGVLVEKPLVWYRVSSTSMVHTTLLFQMQLRRTLKELYPNVFID